MRRLILSLLLFAFAGMLFAANVELQDAKNVALNAYYQKLNTYQDEVDFSNLEIKDHFAIKHDGETVMYAINFTNYGFILIAAEDAIEPVLGYSFNNNYTPEGHAEGFTGTMYEYGIHIQYLRENNIEASPEIAQQWNALKSFDPSGFAPTDDSKDIEPLLTCTWGQGNPYDYYCPEDANGARALVGCVATAMSQIMLYWRYPYQGTGEHTYYQYPYGDLSANFGEAFYDWEGMQDNASTINLPMALISYHTGISVEMEYGTNASGAYSTDVDDAFRNYFNYTNQCQYKQRQGTALSTWKTWAINEVEDNCPVYYSGQSPEGGHAFVLDGYHSADDMYHFNWGWDGFDNGWFAITDAGGFTQSQAMIINIYPDDPNYPYGCTPDFELTNMAGSIEDGSGPQESYENGTSCSWLINPQTAQDSVSKIKLEFVVLDTESDDVVTLYDGSSTNDPVLGTYSGSTTPTEDIYSTGNQMLIVFEADGDANTGTGFRVEYDTYLPSWCSGLTSFTDPTGTFNDGSGDFWYKNGTNCMWKIAPNWAMDITLTFTEFNTEEGVDEVNIYDATNNQLLATISGNYTGGVMPDPVVCPNGHFFITFQSDGAMNGSGFTANWEIATGIEGQDASFEQLMVYPNPAENLLNISFNIDQTQSFDIKLISATGQVVYNERTQDFTGQYLNRIDISNFAKGVYFLNMQSETGTVNKKVVVK